MSEKWHTRALAALNAFTDPGEFKASTLPSIIRGHERPDIDALWHHRLGGDFAAYRAATDEWEAQNPGQSEGNMRRICERLVSEGVLIHRRVVRGWHVQSFYRLAPDRPT